MLCHLIHCNGYKLIRSVTVQDFSELPALCRAEEERTNDGYAVLASHNGEFVADSEMVTERQEENTAYQAGYAYACGYRD